mmetsp:Transcript_40464/g.41282  ORF Transcript_40464/g.41282 Transcript_40464/m.41282 type:complete len:307 (+) Transcript_40464:105-1025(+)
MMRASHLVLLFAFLALSLKSGHSRSQGSHLPQSKLVNDLSPHKLFQIRGGEVVSGKKKQSILKSAMLVFDQVKPVTRAYLMLSLFCTFVEVIGLPAPALFSLDKANIYQIWRILTSKAYLGFNLSMANNLYFLIRYGQALETINGTGFHAWFVLVQTVILSILGLLLGFPFQAKSFVSSTIYTSCHMNPTEKMQFQFEIIITAWQLPFCLMVMDCLTSQSLEAASPHVLGIFSGHVFHFFTKVWPELGGRAWLNPPKWFVDKLGGKPRSNIEVISSLNKKNASGKGVKPKRKITGTGRKLGSSTSI